jgi:hypothetical protein
MTNNKQHNPIDWISNQFYELLEQYSQGDFDRSTFNELMLATTYKAREMYQDKMEAEIIKQCATLSTIKASSYKDGFNDGYMKASRTTGTTNTTFLCTEFVSDQLFYKGTLPHCMRCGKPQYQHPIITNTI